MRAGAGEAKVKAFGHLGSFSLSGLSAVGSLTGWYWDCPRGHVGPLKKPEPSFVECPFEDLFNDTSLPLQSVGSVWEHGNGRFDRTFEGVQPQGGMGTYLGLQGARLSDL